MGTGDDFLNLPETISKLINKIETQYKLSKNLFSWLFTIQSVKTATCWLIAVRVLGALLKSLCDH